MGLHNYVLNGQRYLNFDWGAVREIRYSIGDRISWEWRNRPVLCDGTVHVGAYDDSIEGDEGGYYIITIEGDVISSIREASKDEFDASRKSLADILDKT
jgi:hypothetical protein